jgi:hypothetical protein
MNPATICELFLALCENRARYPDNAEFWRRLAGSVRKARAML